jgi:hypothetical protein
MSKKNFTTALTDAVPLSGLSTLIGEARENNSPNLKRLEQPQPGRPKKEGTPRTGVTKAGEDRATFILPITVIQDIKQIAQYEGVQIKEVVTRIFNEYLRSYNPDQHKPKPKQKPQFTTK